MVEFFNREKWWQEDRKANEKPFVKDIETYDIAASFIPDDSSIDTTELEREWVQHWVDSGCREIKNHDLAFIGFVKNKFRK